VSPGGPAYKQKMPHVSVAAVTRGKSEGDTGAESGCLGCRLQLRSAKTHVRWSWEIKGGTSSLQHAEKLDMNGNQFVSAHERVGRGTWGSSETEGFVASLLDLGKNGAIQ